MTDVRTAFSIQRNNPESIYTHTHARTHTYTENCRVTGIKRCLCLDSLGITNARFKETNISTEI
jgi:hypothetical protein